MHKLIARATIVLASLTLLAGSATAFSQSDLTVTSSSVAGGYAYGTLSTSAYSSSAIVFINSSVTWRHTCANADGTTFDTDTVTNGHTDVYNVTPVSKGKKVTGYNWSITNIQNAPATNACPSGTTEIHAPVVVASSGQAYLSTDGGFTVLTDGAGQPVSRPLGW